MNKIGLCSVTFRKLSVTEIIDLAKQAEITGIEWGGDIHVPANDIDNAKLVAKKTREAGLEVASYGSYYKVGESDNKFSFDEVLKTALALETKNIRIWAGNIPSSQASLKQRDAIIAETKEIAALAKQHDITLSFEYHYNTLADSLTSARALIEAINMDNVALYWQSDVGISFIEKMYNLRFMKHHVSNVHVFYWDESKREKLADGYYDWLSYLKQLNLALDKPRYYFIEFVKDDDPKQFLEDVKTLKQVLADSEK